MDDAEIARRIQELGLELEYLRELAAALGFAADEGWSDAVFAAIDAAEPDQRRRAALRTLALADE
jgi:predicted secreted protein